jgi:hypothetical protein
MDLSDIKEVMIALLIGAIVGCGEQSTTVQKHEQYVELPDPKLGIADKLKVPESPPSRMVISIDLGPNKEPKIYWGEQPIKMSEISDAVARNPSWKVFLRVCEDTPHLVLEEVQNQILLGGQSEILLSRVKAPE